MLYHATFIGPALHPEFVPRPIVFPHQIGASLLLVISAYFACVTIRKGSIPRYWWGRMARLFPPFVAAVLLAATVLWLFAPEDWWAPTWTDIWANLGMLWNWKPQDWPYIDGSHWTVPMQLMAFTAAAALWATRWGHGRNMRVLVWLMVLVPVLQWPYRVSDPPELYRTLADGFGLHRWHLFVAGIAIWMWSTKRVRTPHFLLLLASAMVAHTLHNHMLTPQGLVTDWGANFGVSLGMALIALAARGPDCDRWIPNWGITLASRGAGISYGVFLVHQSIGYVLMRRLQDVGVSPGWQAVAMLVCAVVVGWALTRVVERPAHRALLRAYDSVSAGAVGAAVRRARERARARRAVDTGGEAAPEPES